MEKQKCHDDKVSTKNRQGNEASNKHPDHGAEKKRLNRIRGQVDGIDRMINERRYCVDIITQIKAAKAALQSLERAILETHLRGCVRTALSSKNAFDIEEKINEIMDVIS